MSNAMYDFMLGGVLNVESTLGNPTFTWKGEDFRCVPNTLNDSAKSVTAGFDEDADFRMTVRLNQFTAGIYPAINDFITYMGYKLLIRQIKKPAHGAFWIYMCELPKGGNR